MSSADDNSSPIRPAPSNALQDEAFIWLSRLVDGAVTRPELQAFKRWQNTSPAHAAAFEEAKRQWGAMKPALVGMLRADPAKAARHERLIRAEGSPLSRRAFLGAAVGATAVAGVAALHSPLGSWLSPGEWTADYRTATGEQRAVDLAERVNVLLNTQTSVRRQSVAGGQIVGIDLISGEAAIDVLDGGPSFSVIAGAGRSVSQGGRFDVRHLDGRTCVTCIEGTVQVEHPAGVRALQVSQQTVYDDSKIGDIALVDPLLASAWRRGELVFNQTPLVQVIEEINRYRPGRVLLLSKSAGHHLVRGRFAIAILDEALLQIQYSFDLNARRLPGGVVVLS